MPNRLINEDSPYLKQHANNPVDWYPWCDKAFERAKKEKKLIFLSIGYSSCHWCHVMEKEVFENEKIAKFLNEHFISIKVDKEERPDIDKYYQEVYQLLNQRPGGWPLSIFMTPDKKPFFAGTYIPPEPKYNMLGFMQLIQKIAELWKKKPEDILNQAKEIDKYMKSPNEPKKAVKFDMNIIEKYIKNIKAIYDPVHGGFSSKPKFPQTSIINTLIKIYQLTYNSVAWDMASNTLKNMAKGGIRDLIDGGFYRYSVDEKWLVPHFEKMAYDNALIARSYLNAYFASKDEFYKNIAFEILDFMCDFMSQNYLFYSASDADSEGEEGKYFIYSYDEIYEKLKEDGFNDKEIKEILNKLSITKKGNFEGKNIVRVEDLCDFKEKSRVFKILKDIRKDRVYPFIDKKIITSWNAMMIETLFIASRIDNRYFEFAQEGIKNLLNRLYINDKLYHVTLIDKEPKIEAFLEDYAYLAIALLQGYKTTLNEEYLALSVKLINYALIDFWEEGKWYFSKGEFKNEADYTDATYPSSAATIVSAMLTLGNIFDEKYKKFSFLTLEYYSEKIYKYLPYCSLFVEDIIRFLKDDFLIKSNKENLIKCSKKIDFFYPFINLKEDVNKKYMLCNSLSCFFESEDCEKILEKFQELK
ncbi:thioredoxin domain-containing protein [Nitrosophilus kaiyonis]|uniref:thioredoxin domain-containing protein n=1 Tax=Nitrosophilus kaiyonis TaxID=2930200 RepID=UPI00249099EE|nr:thioredoxin domain-containing protein [Nitrosophilus kaiyonis]